MCDSSAYLISNGEEILVLEHIDFFEAGKDNIRLVSIFGEEMTIKARIKGLSLLDHKIYLENLMDL